MTSPIKPVGSKSPGLTQKQEAFCLEYLKDMNAAAAARRAGFSLRSAPRQAIQLLSNPHVSQRLAELQAARAKRAQVDADHVLHRLMEELDAEAKDIFDPESNTLLPVHQWPEVWQRGLVTSIQTTELYAKDHQGRNIVIGHHKNVIFADRVKRLELLGKHISVQAFREKVQVGVDDPLAELFKQIKGQVMRPAIEGQAQRIEPDRPALPFSPASKERTP